AYTAFGFRSGSTFLKEYLFTLQKICVNHVIINLKTAKRPVAKIIQEQAETFFPDYMPHSVRSSPTKYNARCLTYLVERCLLNNVKSHNYSILFCTFVLFIIVSYDFVVTSTVSNTFGHVKIGFNDFLLLFMHLFLFFSEI